MTSTAALLLPVALGAIHGAIHFILAPLTNRKATR